MTNKTRRHIWPLAVMSLVAFGAFAVVVALSMGGPQTVSAHDCDDISDPVARATCLTVHEQQGEDHDQNGAGMNGNGMNGAGMMPMTAAAHATMPTYFWLEGLDNGARLSWHKPKDMGAGATVIGYRIDRDAWNPESSHPINMYGDATINLRPLTNVLAADYSDRGLAYDTVYTYMVQAIVEYDVEHWWNNLNCMMMNHVVKPASDEPQVGPDTPGVGPYCVMYDGLSDAAKTVVHRAYDAQEGKYPDYNSYGRYALGEWSMKRSVETAVSGGLLDALIAPPSPPRNVMTAESCTSPREKRFTVMVSWDAPSDFGKVPAEFPGCTVCTNQTPIHHGGTQAGIEIQPGTAMITGYMVERKIGNGAWETVATNVTTMFWNDTDRDAGRTYHYRVTAMNNAGLYSDPSEVATIRVDEPEKAQVPTSPDADPIAAAQPETAHVLFTWDPPGTAAGEAHWRTEDDVDVAAGNKSKGMTYIIQRLALNEPGAVWVTLDTQKHQYLPNVSAAEAINNVQTQQYKDRPATGEYKYRVSAQLDRCAPSEWVVTAQEVQFTADLGDASGLAAVAAPVPGVVNLSWTPAPNAPVHWLAGIKQSDWDAGVYTGLIWTETDGSNSHVLSGLSSGEEYVFAVIGGGSVNGPWSSWTALMRVTPN